MDLNKLIARAKGILVTPKTEWPIIAGEATNTADLYKGYIAILAAIPAIFGFLQLSAVSNSVFAGHLRLGMGAALTRMIIAYLLSLVGVYIVALIVEALAPTFGGQKDRIQALKSVAYAQTAGWVAGIGYIVPGLGLLVMLAGGIYSIYLLYLGLPHTMKCPPDKAAGYTAITIIVAIIVNIIAASLVTALVGGAVFTRTG